MMITSKLEQIDESTVQGLLLNGVSESKTLEYKVSLPGGSDSEKKEFLADVSAMANTGGGDLIYGIAEDKGVPNAVPGLMLPDPDRDIARIESLINSGIHPRIRYEIRLVKRSSGDPVLVIRVERSWNAPHRVEYAGHNRFYARTSTGKYQMDVAQLRSAFTFSNTASDRIRDFRADRLIKLLDGRVPVSFEPGRKLIIHLIPVDSLTSGATYDVLQFAGTSVRVRPMFNPSTWSRRINLDGVVFFDGGNFPSTTFTQLYRNGIIEIVGRLLLSGSSWQRDTYPHVALEHELLAYSSDMLRLQNELEVTTPIAICVAMTDVKGMQMANNFGSVEIQEDHLILPETILESFSVPPGKIVKPICDLIWNALGYEKSTNFDADGNWISRGY